MKMLNSYLHTISAYPAGFRPNRLAALLLVLLLLLPAPVAAAGTTIRIACGALGLELQLCREASESWARQTGNQISIVSTPNSATDRLALYLQLLASRSADIDVLQIDVVWSGMLAPHLMDLNPMLGPATADMFPALVRNSLIDGRLVAIPWYIDVGLLYYRRDLLEKHGFQPPPTWQDLTRIATIIQQRERVAGNGRLWGHVFQGKAYEGLTCNALEWVASHRGGSFIDDRRQPTAANPQAADALRLAANWIGGISPPGVLSYDEEAARALFQSGNAVFMRNWAYAWALAQAPGSPVKDRIGVMPLPKGGADGIHVGALGGGQLAVSRYSRHPREAADLVRYLTSSAVQKERSIRASYNPATISLYQDAEILAANPFYRDLLPAFHNALPRPANLAGARYNQLSFVIWQSVHRTLAGRMPAAAALTRLEDDIDRIGHRAGWE